MLDLWPILVDLGLVILTWLVQLVIYPGFEFYSSINLQKWHSIYTKRITIIVLPLMFAQLIFHTLETVNDPNICNIVNEFLVISMWVITFIWAVPLHKQLDSKINLTKSITQLNLVHTFRTIGWTIIFIITLFTK